MELHDRLIRSLSVLSLEIIKRRQKEKIEQALMINYDILDGIANWPDGFGLDIEYSSKNKFSSASEEGLYKLSVQPIDSQDRRNQSMQVVEIIQSLQVNLKYNQIVSEQ